MITALLLANLGTAHAQSLTDSSNHIDAARGDVHANFGGYGSLGAGFRVDIPIAREGIIAGANDELAISPGADVFFYDYFPDYYAGGPYVVPSAVLQWNFYVDPRWSLFPEAGVAFYVGNENDMRRPHPIYAAADFGLGARYHMNGRNALLMRVATPTGFQLGATF